MPRGKEQQKGIDYEESLAKKIGARLQPGSGNQWWARLDLSKQAVLWSLKHTGKQSFRITREILREAIVAASREGCIPAWAFDVAGEDFVLMRGNDFRMLMEEDHKIIAASKRSKKRKKASVPVLLRERE